MRIEQRTATILCKIKSHRSEPLNETADDIADLGRTIDQEHAVWTEECTYVNMEPRSEERGTTGSWTLQIRSTTAARSAQLVAGVESTAERSGSGNI